MSLTKPILPLKFIPSPLLSAQELSICHDFYDIRPEENIGWGEQAQIICQEYGISYSYLLQCLMNIRVYNPNYRCMDCGVFYSIIDPCSYYYPTKDASKKNSDNRYFFSQKPSHTKVIPTNQWQCDNCQIFSTQGINSNHLNNLY